MRKKFNSSAWRLIFWIVVLIPVYYVLYKIYIPKTNAFGCFDDCFNYVGGYFLGRGKQLYSQIYFNHMPLMAYASFLVQHFGNPVNIYAVVLQHRQFLLLFGFLFNVFVCWRFGIVGLSFTLLYEFSKFYVFGDRFLAESLIVYPLVYLTGLGLHSLLKKLIAGWEMIAAAVCLWFVVFMREPYVLVAIFLFAVIIRSVLFKRIGRIAVIVFLLLTAGLFLLFPVQDFIYNVIIINAKRGLPNELSAGNFFGSGIIQSFFYPVYVFFAGTWNDFKIQLASLSVILFFSTGILVKAKKIFWFPAFLFISLGLANLRPTVPGLQYYSAFHETNWYGMFLFASLYVLYESMRDVRKKYVYFIITGLLMVFVVGSPRSFIYQYVDQQGEFLTNYGTYLQVGEVIKAVSTPQQTLFTNGADEFLYLASGRNSAYPYSFYYPTQFKDRYYDAAIAMFRTNPPDILYDFCSSEAPVHPYFSEDILPMYTQWYSGGKPTCLYIKKSLISGLTQSQRTKAEEFLYYLPEK